MLHWTIFNIVLKLLIENNANRKKFINYIDILLHHTLILFFLFEYIFQIIVYF